jgi:hypothetical protein
MATRYIKDSTYTAAVIVKFPILCIFILLNTYLNIPIKCTMFIDYTHLSYFSYMCRFYIHNNQGDVFAICLKSCVFM